MTIRYIYMGCNDGELEDSEWMKKFEDVSIQQNSVFQAAHIMKCSLLVVQRDPATGFMSPIGFVQKATFDR
jgi:hypothetical protein